MLRLVPSLRSFADPLTEAMVEFYLKSQVKHELHACRTMQHHQSEMMVVHEFECSGACSDRVYTNNLLEDRFVLLTQNGKIAKRQFMLVL